MSYFLSFILFISSVDSFSSASRQLSLKTGASVTIPCHYDRKYIQHKKYWCYGIIFNFCKIQAYANDTKGKVTVTDYPAESLFTVTMNELQTGNTGWYWCAVEISGPDVKEYLYITVKSDPDLSVMESRVSGEEGGSVTVQCLYSSAYQNTQKQWCRFKDECGNSVGRTDTSQNSAVHISDDGRRSFSVQMSGLKKSDAGWYWCSAGDLQFPVHISVHDPPPVVTTAVTTTTHHVTPYIGGETLIHWYLVALILLLVILVIIICCKKCKNQIRTRERSNDTTVHTPTFPAEDSIIYSTVAVSKPNSSASKDNEQDVTYSIVNIASKNKSMSPNNVDVENIYSNVVCQ
ncbi:polymeric immunoglobulin receptor-like isoform X2 [Pangasianodon hypophthalmus]|uniref:polymeric immunoglobulin receptor-like isoform X2 n=1 Tax=Pangasianodon hypophthalmus TaxID=310915 RepID=UPI0023073565|nr:polymeric immunoglobulin receptor-like isoform X2 [Pangasianodon hypophthalmus]